MGLDVLYVQSHFFMTAKEKLIFIISFIWALHWGTRVTLLTLDMVILNGGARILPLGL